MKGVYLCALVFCIGFVACADRSTESASSNHNMLAGMDASPPSTERTEIASAESVSNTVSKTVGTSTGDSDREATQVLKQNISLAQTSASSINTAASDRKIIRNAEINLEADNPEEAQRRITSVAEANGGFVVESQQSSSDNQSITRDIVVMSVRVPSDRFSETLDEIRKMATRVVTETVKGQDVTEEFIDIEAQMKAKKALEAQFMEIMKKANTVGDALVVQRQLADVRGEIERVEGRKRFLENQSSLSTIKVRLQTAKVFAAASAGFGTRITEAFSSGFDVAMTFVLGLITFVVALLPFALFVGLPSFVIIRYVLKRQSRPKSVTEIAEEEIRST